MTNPQQNQPTDEDRDKVITVVLSPKGIPPFTVSYTLAALNRYTKACFESQCRRRLEKAIEAAKKQQQNEGDQQDAPDGGGGEATGK